MFRPSPSLLFHPMPTLNKFKIHPPLPLNPRQSKQLLDLLTASFRQHLDAEHGHGDFRTTLAVKQQPSPNAKQRRHSLSDSDARPTDRHMNSILTNPLFSLPPDRRTSKSKRDPMLVFDEAVAKGMMNLNYARACLIAKQRDITQSSVPIVREGMKESGAGRNVLKWLVSSGMANDIKFLKDEAFAAILMQYMVAEGLQEVCWQWIKNGFEGISQFWTIRDSIHWKAARADIARPLFLLLSAEASGTESLDAAYLCMSRAAGYLKGMTTAQMRAILGPPGWYLAQQTINHSERQLSSSSAFESFLSLVPVISTRADYQFAHLHLFHPSQPSADLALAYLWKQYMEGANTMELRSNPILRDRNTMRLGLDTAKFLLEHERYKEAEWVMGYLRERYPEQLGVKETRQQLEQVEAEASSLRLLDGLGLA